MTMTLPDTIVDLRSSLAASDAPAVERPALVVRRELPADHERVAALHTEVFAAPDEDGPPGEVGLVEAVRSSNAYVFGLSLVAEVGDELVGHVLLSRATIDDRHPALALAPLGVRASHRGRGVGTALVNGALGAADALGHTMVGVLGHPGFYGRFGFTPSAAHGIQPPEDWWGESFLVRPLTTASEKMQGQFRYSPAFSRD
jgi:putative acetyltransferase